MEMELMEDYWEQEEVEDTEERQINKEPITISGQLNLIKGESIELLNAYNQIKDRQLQIVEINRLVDEYKAGNNDVVEVLLAIFKPFLIKQCNKYDKIYPGVHNWSSVEQEALVIFRDLLDEYTVGGRAYFNVFMMRKLPLRLRYFFIKEIKHRGKNLCHEEDQMLIHNLISEDDDIGNFIEDTTNREDIRIIMELIESDLLSDRERDMLKQNIIGAKTHAEIAEQYGVSRSRVSKIVGDTIKKIRAEYEDYIRFRGGEIE